MTDKTRKILRLTYYTAVTVALVVAGVCLMAACLTLYRSGGESPFTRAAVAAQFATIAVPVWVCVGIVALGFVLHPLLPQNPTPKADMTATALKRLAARTDLAACPAELKATIQKQRLWRAIHNRITLCLLLIGSVLFLWYASDVSRFDTGAAGITPSVATAAWILLACMILPFGYAVFAAFFSRHSQKRELALLKQAPVDALSPAQSAAAQEKSVLWVQSILLAVGVGLVVYGLLGNGAEDTLLKAVAICKECIGIG